MTRIIGNFPNPFHRGTSIKYHLAKAAPVQIQIYNSRGQLVYKTNIASKSEGDAEFVWNGKDSLGNISSNGIYQVRMVTPAGTSHHRMTLLK
jgi:flagellar hook assembly protein FlgD